MRKRVMLRYGPHRHGGEVMAVICGLIFFFGLLDAANTLVWVGMGYAKEVNPFTAWVMTYSDWAFVVTKMAITGMACLVFYHYRAHRMSQISAWVLAILMGLLVLWQAASPLYYLGLI